MSNTDNGAGGLLFSSSPIAVYVVGMNTQLVYGNNNTESMSSKKHLLNILEKH